MESPCTRDWAGHVIETPTCSVSARYLIDQLLPRELFLPEGYLSGCSSLTVEQEIRALGLTIEFLDFHQIPPIVLCPQGCLRSYNPLVHPLLRVISILFPGQGRDLEVLPLLHVLLVNPLGVQLLELSVATNS